MRRDCRSLGDQKLMNYFDITIHGRYFYHLLLNLEIINS